ncbi:hypothetical protein BCR33DRAFT_769980 [Rhizoclosmatium globosum]|uniref:IgA peptidase M64 n=1 Tax=Rhizoclosmatium globosum TaxID=329046 RepID=A0A1Y2BQP0_9FUNG|nr:hypothetical protein BCR33DRAFT_769980 [Rhizoclosmatium globosum]|eukprot:ORY37069.1 hypothetical protein BCR33DRAFT_769980 [Rhizoclosmatium globosum]
MHPVFPILTVASVTVAATQQHVLLAPSSNTLPTTFIELSLHRHLSTNHCSILDQSQTTQPDRRLSPKTPAIVSEQRRDFNNFEYIKILGTSPASVTTLTTTLCPAGATPLQHTTVAYPPPTVKQLISSGPSSNRIDVVLMGDGYTRAQESLFFDDMQRLTDEMWDAGAFEEVLPFFNVWAVFVESRESGIGVGGVAKDTVFGLYRDGTELRGVYPSKPEVARAVCKATGPNACDFPSLIANDPFYGGLGGEFTIGTSSHTTGTLVLRHEFGHTMIQVGEEYDGGEAYRPYILNFTSTGDFQRWHLRITASGVETPDSLQVLLDGKKLDWTTSGDLDRHFSDWINNESGFSEGEHTLEFRQGYPPASPDAPIRQLCSVTLHEFGSQEEYHFSPDYIGAFPTFSLSGKKSYRPSHESCLMRNMSSPHFCPVCKEGLFLQLLRRVSLIDDVTTTCLGDKSVAKLHLLPFAHHRKKPVFGERYVITWFKDGEAVERLNGKEEIAVGSLEVVGEWSVSVRIDTPIVRSDPDGILESVQGVVWSRCGL